MSTFMFIAAWFIKAKIWKQPVSIHGQINNKILLSHIKEWNHAICENVGGSRWHYAKWTKSDRERQILYDFTYMWNLKIKQNKQTNKTEKIS